MRGATHPMKICDKCKFRCKLFKKCYREWYPKWEDAQLEWLEKQENANWGGMKLK
jgi:hypothetical protein